MSSLLFFAEISDKLKSRNINNYDSLKLWKVDGVKVNEQEINLDKFFTENDIQANLGGVLMESQSQRFLNKYFTENDFKDDAFKEAIHIIVQVLVIFNSLEWSIASLDTTIIVSNVDASLSKFSELFTRCCNEKFKLPIFKPDKVHPHYNAVRNLQIPSNPKCKQRPFLLMDDLPTTNGDNELANTTDLEELSEIKKIMIVLDLLALGRQGH
ncbi:hypothetical protein RclHR1_00570014 [Rhizophagus clarus]|uniref:Uncharacterized protein n=1 Tax=Rhizophagus clarus TaxID=94130 RepID=A0A2Z6RN91_9GLOM|nr:hypothetical protein RclHR1_00570014 [Rhizophagus clarus]GET04220.1 hypothetical protein GLOIN_2v1551520 [Rhizophagus clarus]